MKRRLFSCFMALCLLIGVLPLQAITVSAAPDTTIMTITIVDGNGNPIPDATVTATRTYNTPGGNQRTVNVALTNNGNGVFTFNTAIYYNGTTLYYTVNASKVGYPSATQHIDPATRSVIVMLGSGTIEPEPEPEPEPEWIAFDMYYIANGVFPESFAAPGEAAKYGPSNNDVPFVTVNVDITALKNKKYADRVAYEENKNGNVYHFIPVGETEAKTHDERIAIVKNFWAAVLECMDDASKQALEDTGLSDVFFGYALKNQNTVQNPDNHCDGILTVEPPVYIVEMNENGVYFGGFANDEKTSQYTTYEQVLGAYEAHYKQGIRWADNGNGTYSGVYIDGNYKYYIMVEQTNAQNANVNPEEGNGLTVKYAKITDDYYLAIFNSKVVSREQIQFKITYTDGITEKVFNDQVTDHEAYEAVPTFAGDASRENFNLVGWTLQGGDGTVMTQEQLLQKYPVVTSDMTFVAVYELKPQTFAGTVEVILNGSYANGVAEGERVDITTVKGDVELYVSANGVDFIKLDKTATGVYSAHLENGTYHIYYYNGVGYTLTGHNQQLDIYDAARTRYLFFNDVVYDLNGGVGGPASLHDYHRTGDAVNVSTAVPTKEGFEFLGWLAEDGTLYAAGTVLTTAISEPYRLTAQWKKINKAKVNVTVIVNGKSADGTIDKNLDREMTIELTYRPVGSSEDYVEVVGQSFTDKDGYYIGETVGDVTTTEYIDLFTDLNIAYEYAANVFMGEYEVTTRTVEPAVVDENGDVTYHVIVEMHYAPEMHRLEYNVVEDIVSDALVPSAVDIKVLAFYDPSIYGFPTNPGKQWYPVTQHFDTTHDVLLSYDSESGVWGGADSYIVWAWEDHETNLPYYYRVSASGVTLKDGTELTLVSTDGVNYSSLASADGRYPAGAYTAVVSVENGVAPEDSALEGVHFTNDVQSGPVTITVYAHPYTVTFDPNEGTLNGTTENTVLADQFIVPNTNAYVPTRDGGYVFDRWVLADENGNPTDQTVTVGDALTKDITLVALWKAPKTINGLVSVGATYVGDDGERRTIYEEDRPQTAIVLLQRIAANGYFETISSQTVTLDYSDEDYYYLGQFAVGVDRYEFTNIPDDGSTYRVQLLLPNYVTMFQQEPQSVQYELYYDTYTTEEYTVVWGTKDPQIGTVNIHNHFEPDEFELQYEVDSTLIGEGFRPDSVEILVTYDVHPDGMDPSNWEVISQMTLNGEYYGDDVILADGFGEGSTPVWISAQDGVTYYQYGLRVHTTTFDGEKVPFDGTQPFTVEYQAPTHFHYGAQEDMLVATLIPNTYNITYVLNGGTMNGDYPTTHTWSYETALDIDDPTMKGFRFLGWYLDEDLTVPAGDVIPADVAQDTTLYAKWLQVMDKVEVTVIVNHIQQGDNGLAHNFNKDLYIQLTRDSRANSTSQNREFVAVDGYNRIYRDGLWHTHGDDVTQDVVELLPFYTNLSSEYDYNALVTLEGYEVDPDNSKVEKIAQPDGSTLHKVTVVLQYYPDLFDLAFYVRVSDHMEDGEKPTSAQVKVTCWADRSADGNDWKWQRITQHLDASVTVDINAETGIGYGSYPVWHWYDEEAQIPYYYRLEVVQINFADGSSVPMNTILKDVVTGGDGYTATVETDGGAVPNIADANNTTTLEGVYGRKADEGHAQQGTLGAVIDLNRVIFHANNEDYEGDDVFRTYYYEKMPTMGESDFLLENGKVSKFYDIPEFEYYTHNKYIFRGWYMDPVSEDEPFNWNTTHSGDVHVYAHWIETGTVAQEEADSKNYVGGMYQGYDLVGVQIRDAENDPLDHHGDPYGGLRFVTVLKEDVYAEINSLDDHNKGGAEYGFVMAKTSTLEKYANAAGTEDYELLYSHKEANGVNTTVDYKYVQNMNCSGVVDHYEGETYFLYTAVITYNGLTGDALQQAYDTAFTARSYIHYWDANGLERVHYNNYTGTNTYHGCSASFTDVQDMMG